MSWPTIVLAVEFGLITLLLGRVAWRRRHTDDWHLWVLQLIVALSVTVFYTLLRLLPLDWRVAYSRWGIFQPLAALFASVIITRRDD